MSRLVLAIAAAAALRAQSLQEVIKRGEELFAQTCATGYCHGARGVTTAGAPRLAARGFTQGYIAATADQGVPGTAMPGFRGALPAADLAAIVAYVAALNGIANPNISGAVPAPAAAAPPLAPQGERGRQLFSDATRGFGRCSTCHEVSGKGLPVAAPISAIPADAAALKLLATPAVSTATVDGETMPILMVASRVQSAIFYDLTVVPPVLRTVLPGAIQNRDGSSWKHSSVIGSYTDPELAAILAYLRAVI